MGTTIVYLTTGMIRTISVLMDGILGSTMARVIVTIVLISLTQRAI